MWDLHRWYDGLREPWRFLLFIFTLGLLGPTSMLLLDHGRPLPGLALFGVMLVFLANRMYWIEVKSKRRR